MKSTFCPEPLVSPLASRCIRHQSPGARTEELVRGWGTSASKKRDRDCPGSACGESVARGETAFLALLASGHLLRALGEKRAKSFREGVLGESREALGLR